MKNVHNLASPSNKEKNNKIYDFWIFFKKLHTKIILFKVFEYMNTKEKFMKEILTKKRRSIDNENSHLEVCYGVIIQKAFIVN